MYILFKFVEGTSFLAGKIGESLTALQMKEGRRKTHYDSHSQLPIVAVCGCDWEGHGATANVSH